MRPVCAHRSPQRAHLLGVTGRLHDGRMPVELSPDTIVARVAERQHGLITFDQAREAGLSADQIKRRCRTGRWHRITKGVYVVAGVPASWRRDVLAACLASPLGSAACFPSSAALHEVWVPPLLPQVMVPPGASARSTIAKVRRGTLDRRDVMTVAGIPCMSPARTLVDAAEILAREPLAELV